ncbi:hypothetical protein [Lysinibacillus sp. NPDC096212]|uniref:hypothetical protein n=1 Tax=Lysinibacillus sp. NPDC096212 TaxID=3364135 RepID=UPI00381437AC
MYWYEYCPKHIESKYELLVFRDNQPFLPLSDYYFDCVGRIDKSSATSYLKCLLPFFKWLEEESNYQGQRVEWNDSEEKIRVVVEEYLRHEMKCKVHDKDSFRLVSLTNKSPNTISRFLSALKSFYKSMIHLKQYTHSNPLMDGQAFLHNYKEELKGVRDGKPRMPSVSGTEEPIFDEATLRKISPERDVNIAKKKYMQLTKEELVNRLQKIRSDGSLIILSSLNRKLIEIPK